MYLSSYTIMKNKKYYFILTVSRTSDLRCKKLRQTRPIFFRLADIRTYVNYQQHKGLIIINVCTYVDSYRKETYVAFVYATHCQLKDVK